MPIIQIVRIIFNAVFNVDSPQLKTTL